MFSSYWPFEVPLMKKSALSEWSSFSVEQRGQGVRGTSLIEWNGAPINLEY